MGTHQQTFPLPADKFYEITVLDMKEKIIRKVENGENVYYIYKRGIFGLGRWRHVCTRTESDMMDYLHHTFNLWDEIIINFKK
jgi:hypothetical protein